MKNRILLLIIGIVICTINNAQQLNGSITDVEGNVYKTVQIGNQTWMAENLKTTKYNDGFAIPLATETDNLYYSSFAPAYCWYKYDETYKSPYGALYNWPTVNTGRLCPIAWHVPTDTEWSTLNDYLGGDKFAGDKMKETGLAHWAILNDSATNESGFTAVPTEVRWGDGSFNSIGYSCTWWSSTEFDEVLAISRGLWYYNSAGIFRQIDGKADCSSIRCIKDNNDSTVQIDLKKGLLAYFPFNGNASDESGNGHSGIVNGATLTTDRFGSPDKAYLFNGQGNYISISGFNLAPSSTTIACWIKAINGSGFENIISKHKAGNSEILVKIVNYKYQIEWTIGNVYFTLNDEFGQFGINPNNPGFDLLVLIYDEQREQARFYVNNILIASHNISGQIVMNDFPMTFGKDSNHNSEYFNGIIDDIRIYNRPLNIEEIGTLYNDRVITVTTPVIKTQTVRLITQNSVTSGGAISSDGGTEITAKGVCWSRYPNPDTTSYETKNGFGIENYNSILTGLTPNTTYYIRAYAINNAGIKYGNEICFRTMDTTKYGIVTDIDGNNYKTVQIGAQKWMAENLKTSKLNDGTMIPCIKENSEWSNIDNVAYCWYRNDSITFKNTFGALYNGYAVNTEKLCPEGWHVPYYAEWDTLSVFLGGNMVSGGKMKEVGNFHWASPNTGANNESEFSALPGGIRPSANGNFDDIFYSGCWWSTQEKDSYGLLYSWYIKYDNCILYPGDDRINSGRSVRCIEDSDDPNRATPVLKTQTVRFITQNSATSESAISFGGGSPITAKGICWSTSSNPDTTNNKTMDGFGVGNYISNITGLTSKTTYYVRAYAINSTGIGYGNELIFETLGNESDTSKSRLSNIALNKSVAQSSTLYGGVPERAVDGNTNGDWDNGSVTHTSYDKNAWWEVDLGGTYKISTIELWNRTNSCCMDRLSDFYVFVSDWPFKSRQLDATLHESNVWHILSSDFPDPADTFSVGRTGRYIRIQSAHTAELNIAEVIVMGSLHKPKPVPTNIALNKPVSQSSTQYGGVPEKAVDGNTNGDWDNGSVTHTFYDNNAWWELDLGGIYNISTIELWNRTNSCCNSRLSDFYVFASDEPFSSSQLDATLNQPNVWQVYKSDYPNPADTFMLGRTARYIRIQSAYSAELNIAEVIVMGSLSERQLGLTNVAQNKPVTQSSTQYGGVPERAVDGNTNGDWDNGSVTHTFYDKNAWWELDLGGIYNISTIELWNRTNSCCLPRLSDFYVFASDEPFSSSQLDAALNQPNVWQVFRSDYPNPVDTFMVGRTARYIRIQSVHSAELNIAEVIVMGTLSEQQFGLTNVARNKPVTQSSTQYGGVPERAVDGNTNGLWEIGSVTHTFYDQNAWWEVDLGGIYNINTIELWNRTNSCCLTRLSEFYVFASEVPFASRQLNATLNQSNVWQLFAYDYPNPSDIFTVNRTARFIRIQSDHSTELNIAEVVIMGTPTEDIFKSTEKKTGSDVSLQADITIYPVPFSNVIYFESKEIINSIEFLNVLGESLILQKCGKSSEEINTDFLMPGLYYARIVMENGKMKTYTVIKSDR